jgi:hypothetical protein
LATAFLAEQERSTVKKHQKMRKTLRLEKEVLLQLDAPKLQNIVGGLSFNEACGTAFICGSQVCP